MADGGAEGAAGSGNVPIDLTPVDARRAMLLYALTDTRPWHERIVGIATMTALAASRRLQPAPGELPDGKDEGDAMCGFIADELIQRDHWARMRELSALPKVDRTGAVEYPAGEEALRVGDLADELLRAMPSLGFSLHHDDRSEDAVEGTSLLDKMKARKQKRERGAAGKDSEAAAASRVPGGHVFAARDMARAVPPRGHMGSRHGVASHGPAAAPRVAGGRPPVSAYAAAGRQPAGYPHARGRPGVPYAPGGRADRIGDGPGAGSRGIQPAVETAPAFMTAAQKLQVEEADLSSGRRPGGAGGDGGGGGRRSRTGRFDNRADRDVEAVGELANRYNVANAPSSSKPGAGRGRRLGVKRKFNPPGRAGEDRQGGRPSRPRKDGGGGGDGKSEWENPDEVPEQLRNLEPRMVEMIENEIIDRGSPVRFDDIAGLAFAKRCVEELVIWPMKRPDLFHGLTAVPKGLLLFGPPGTGKTLIGKAIAHQSGATFFNISASSLTSKWVGEGEKMVRTLFAVASVKQPSVIFIDEIDSLLTQRSEQEMESTRRVKTEFLVQLDGAGTREEDLVLVVGATNRPQELDEAARRRFVKRLYIPLPDDDARLHLLRHLLKSNKHSVSDAQFEDICRRTKGYSGADMNALCKEAAMGPIRSGLMGIHDITEVTSDVVPPITSKDFESALGSVRSSVAHSELADYIKWNDTFGSYREATAADLSIAKEGTGAGGSS